ncbi:hypothetical protein ZWY2020_038138 [Hordeum vulgare]|nr:hypothetical protein ZWY2020_038138 [Hordeum vulgare]
MQAAQAPPPRAPSEHQRAKSSRPSDPAQSHLVAALPCRPPPRLSVAHRKNGATTKSPGSMPSRAGPRQALLPCSCSPTPGQPLRIASISPSDSVLFGILLVNQVACWNLMENFLTKCSVESDLA